MIKLYLVDKVKDTWISLCSIDGVFKPYQLKEKPEVALSHQDIKRFSEEGENFIYLDCYQVWLFSDEYLLFIAPLRMVLQNLEKWEVAGETRPFP